MLGKKKILEKNVDKDIAAPIIHATKNYDQFKLIAGNRKVSLKHVNELTQVISEVNLLAFNPIIVTKDKLILDGQHRLAVAKNNELTIYYVMIGKGDLRIVQMLNNINRHWSIEDYLHSYIAVGLPQYIRFYQYMQDYGLTSSNLLHIITGGGATAWKHFKRGEFEITDESELELYLQAYIKIKDYMEEREAWIDREFINSFRKLLEQISVEEFIMQLEKTGMKIGRHVLQRDYLRTFEYVLNKNKHEKLVRLF